MRSEVKTIMCYIAVVIAAFCAGLKTGLFMSLWTTLLYFCFISDYAFADINYRRLRRKIKSVFKSRGFVEELSRNGEKLSESELTILLNAVIQENTRLGLNVRRLRLLAKLVLKLIRENELELINKKSLSSFFKGIVQEYWQFDELYFERLDW